MSLQASYLPSKTELELISEFLDDKSFDGFRQTNINDLIGDLAKNKDINYKPEIKKSKSYNTRTYENLVNQFKETKNSIYSIIRRIGDENFVILDGMNAFHDLKLTDVNERKQLITSICSNLMYDRNLLPRTESIIKYKTLVIACQDNFKKNRDFIRELKHASKQNGWQLIILCKEINVSDKSEFDDILMIILITNYLDYISKLRSSSSRAINIAFISSDYFRSFNVEGISVAPTTIDSPPQKITMSNGRTIYIDRKLNSAINTGINANLSRVYRDSGDYRDSRYPRDLRDPRDLKYPRDSRYPPRPTPYGRGKKTRKRKHKIRKPRKTKKP